MAESIERVKVTKLKTFDWVRQKLHVLTKQTKELISVFLIDRQMFSDFQESRASLHVTVSW